MTDEFTLIQVRCRKGIYSRETALFFHGLTDQPRLQIAVTIPAGYCVNRIKEDFQHITFHRTKGSLWWVRIMERIPPQGGVLSLSMLRRFGMLSDRPRIESSPPALLCEEILSL